VGALLGQRPPGGLRRQ